MVMRRSRRNRGAAMADFIGQYQSGRIVVGVDGSEASKDALQWAIAQAQRTGSSVIAIMTWEEPSAAYGFGMPMPTGFDLRSYYERALQGEVQEVTGERAGVNVSAVVTEGDPAKTLVAAAKNADLLVVGTRGHGEVVGRLLGSVSEYCVTHASCPVVVVHRRQDGALSNNEAVGSAATN
jgi:nucleotide-binding universal stress UspA family protein